MTPNGSIRQKEDTAYSLIVHFYLPYRMIRQVIMSKFGVVFSCNCDDVVHDDGHIAVTAAQDDFVGFGRCFWKVAEVEFLFVSDLYDLKAFLYEVGRKLPQLFKVAVAVEDCRKIFDRVVCGDSKVV